MTRSLCPYKTHFPALSLGLQLHPRPPGSSPPPPPPLRILLSLLMATSPTTTTHHRHGGRAVPFPFLLFLVVSLLSSAQAQTSIPRDPYGNTNWGRGFSPAMAIIIVFLISAFFFMVFFSVYLRQCGRRADGSTLAPGTRALGARSTRRARGLDPAVIQTLPTLVYAEVKEHKAGKGALECAVCLCEFEDEETLRLLPKCDHVFHTDCIDAWLSSHTTCPVCRTNLSPDSDAAAAAAVADDDPSAAGAPAAAAVDGAVSEEQPGEVSEGQPGHVAITIDEPEAAAETPRRRPDLPPMLRIGSKSRQRWWPRSLVRPSPRFPRSHSTGHSMAVVQPGEDCERFTLRLPDNIRREVMAGKFQRSASSAAAEEGSTRRGQRAAAGEGTSRSGGHVGGRSFKLRRWDWAAKSDRWAFFGRASFSLRVSRGDGGAGEGSSRRGEGGSTRKGSLDCLTGGNKADDVTWDDEAPTKALAAAGV